MSVGQVRRQHEAGDAGQIGRAVRTGHGAMDSGFVHSGEHVPQLVAEAGVFDAHSHKLGDGEVDLCAQQHLAQKKMAREPQRHVLNRRGQLLVHARDDRTGGFIVFGRGRQAKLQ